MMGVQFLTIPKGLSLSILKTLAQTNKPDCNIDTSSAPTYMERQGETSVDKTYQIVITSSILQGSRIKEGAQKSLDKRLKENLEIPYGLEATTLCLLTYQCFSKCLLKEKDIFIKTYALCIQSLSDKRPCYVGNFQYDDGMRMHEDGPWYDSSSCDTYFQVLDNMPWTKDVGIIAMKRISTK
jgi:hypothetical protein